MSDAKDKQLATMDSVFRALGDPTRLRILGLLAAGGEVCVCHIHEALDCSQPMASRHLSYLRKAGLVEGRRDGQWIYYRVASMREPVMGEVSPETRRNMELWVGCIAGALQDTEYVSKLTRAGFTDVTVEPWRIYEGTDGDGRFASAFIRATKRHQ